MSSRVPDPAGILRPLRLAAAVLTLALLVWPGPAPGAGSEKDVFSGERALELVVAQCELGPRIPGSPGNAALRRLIHDTAGRCGFPSREQCFSAVLPLTGDEVEICNVVVSIPGGGDGPGLWVGAHFDTRPHCDRDPDPAARLEPLVGANDGASGVAVLLHLMEVLAGRVPPADVELLFFDGEDAGLGGDPRGFCLGSGRMAESWGEFGSPLPQAAPRGLILLDMVGDRDLLIPQEAYSLQYAPEWTRTVFERAQALGLDAFQPFPGPPVFDDHVPFLRRGIPALDLIDFDYRFWHTLEDTPDKCSAGSLAQVGSLVLDLILAP
ncbi:MAG: M28 family peptidase [bacterium]